MPKPFVRVLGVALAVGACQKPTEPEPPVVVLRNPPPPEPAPDAAPEPAPDAAPGVGVIPEVGADPAAPTGTLDPADQPPTANPPAPLPLWDDVASSHPKGATNPPSPVLIVARDDNSCHKGWMGGMIPPPPPVAQAGGKVVATRAEVGTATEIQCPPGEPARLLAAWDALPAEVREATHPPVPGRRR